MENAAQRCFVHCIGQYSYDSNVLCRPPPSMPQIVYLIQDASLSAWAWGALAFWVLDAPTFQILRIPIRITVPLRKFFPASGSRITPLGTFLRIVITFKQLCHYTSRVNDKTRPARRLLPLPLQLYCYHYSFCSYDSYDDYYYYSYCSYYTTTTTTTT